MRKRTYVQDPSEAPEGAELHEGPRGGVYYEDGGETNTADESGAKPTEFAEGWETVTAHELMEEDTHEVQERSSEFLTENTAAKAIKFGVTQPDYIRETGSRFAKLDQTFDLSDIDRFGDMGEADLVAPKMMDTAVGYFIADAGLNQDEIQVIVDPTSYKKPRGIGIDPEDWLVTNCRFQTVAHEVAHYLHFKEFKRREDDPRRAWNRYSDRLDSDEEELLEDEVSLYAATNTFEAIAEIATGLMYGYEFSDEVMALYEKHGGPEVDDMGFEEISWDEEPEETGYLKADENPWLAEAKIVADSFRRWAGVTEKDRVYVDTPEEVPEGVEIQEGPRGGYFYEDGGGESGDDTEDGDGIQDRLAETLAGSVERYQEFAHGLADAVDVDPIQVDAMVTELAARYGPRLTQETIHVLATWLPRLGAQVPRAAQIALSADVSEAEHEFAFKMSIGMFAALASETPDPTVEGVDAEYANVVDEDGLPDGQTAAVSKALADVLKERVYVESEAEIPAEAEAQRGPRDGIYYEPTGDDGEAESSPLDEQPATTGLLDERFTPAEDAPGHLDPTNVAEFRDLPNTGVSANAMRIGVMEDGSRAFYTAVAEDGNRDNGYESTREAERAMAAHNFMDALGVPVPEHHYKEGEWFAVEGVEGEIAFAVSDETKAKIDKEDFLEIGAMTMMTGNIDMHGDNVMVSPDGTIHAIDLDHAGGDISDGGGHFNRALWYISATGARLDVPSTAGTTEPRHGHEEELGDDILVYTTEYAKQLLDSDEFEEALQTIPSREFRENIRANVESFATGDHPGGEYQ